MATSSSPGTPASPQQSAATPSTPANQIMGQPTATAVVAATMPPSPSPTATATVSTAAQPPPTAPPWTPAPTAGGAPATPTVTPPAFVATDRIGTEIPVNFRAGPGTDYPIETTLAPGAALHATGESTLVADILWRQFRLADGRLGWVRDLDVVPALP